MIGKFKDETGDKVIKTFVGVRSKVYAIETEDPINKKLNESKKLKGIPKMIVKKKMTLNDYRERGRDFSNSLTPVIINLKLHYSGGVLVVWP